MKQLNFKGESVSELGIGTWNIGEGDARQSSQEITAIQYGLEHGINFIDTAEMYGEGKSETLVGQAIQPYDRDKLFITSKFYPFHATPSLMRASLTKSLQRLKIDYLDLYLLHWRGNTPLVETVQGMYELQAEGLIKHWGVSNFDTSDLQELIELPHGKDVFANEDLYNLRSRGIEFDLLPWQAENNIPFIGYSPFGSGNGKGIDSPELRQIAQERQVSVQAILLAWVTRHHDVLSIPKASQVEHVTANIAATEIKLTAEELARLDQDFPAPIGKQALDVI
ncbi:aldo/keto reductase [Secundilactobacillus oryzae]|nr:aldo/keto reductase [Secundilactobacillus oryzae]